MFDKRLLGSPESSQAEKLRKMPEEIQLKDLMELLMKNSNSLANNEAKILTIERSLATLLERTERNEKEIFALKAEVSDLSARLNEREQMDLIDKFKITGLPPISPTENVRNELLLKIFSKADMTCSMKDFIFVTMHCNANKTSAIIMGKYATHAMRVDAFAAFRKKSVISPITYGTVMDCAPNDQNSTRNLRLRSFLTKATLELANKTREHRGTIFEFVWENEGRILARKPATGSRKQPAINIKSL